MKIKLTVDFREQHGSYDARRLEKIGEQLTALARELIELGSKYPIDVHVNEVFDDDELIGDDDGGVGNLIGRRLIVECDELHENKIMKIIKTA